MVRGALAGEGKKLGCGLVSGVRVRLLISTFDPSLVSVPARYESRCVLLALFVNTNILILLGTPIVIVFFFRYKRGGLKTLI